MPWSFGPKTPRTSPSPRLCSQARELNLLTVRCVPRRRWLVLLLPTAAARRTGTVPGYRSLSPRISRACRRSPVLFGWQHYHPPLEHQAELRASQGHQTHLASSRPTPTPPTPANVSLANGKNERRSLYYTVRI
jgi:hypothetical protein